MNARPDADRVYAPYTALPSPEESEPATMPRDDRLRFDDDDASFPLAPDARQPHPEHPVGPRDPHASRTGSLEDVQLVSQGEHLEQERRAGAHRRAECLK